MNALIVDLFTLIEADTHWRSARDMFGGREPAAPSNTLTIFNEPGQGRFLGTSRNEDDKGSDAYEYTGFQIRIRNRNYLQAITQAGEIIDVLHGVGNTVVNGTLYTVIESLDSPYLLEWDNDNRAKIIANFSVQRTPYND